MVALAPTAFPPVRARSGVATHHDPTLHDPGTPLRDVTFTVIDLETTGFAPKQSRIIEVAAARFRGGERLGTFQTLVNPGAAVPPFVVVLTGITDTLLLPAPPVEEVLPTLLEFLGDTVLVGHNLRFDTGFLDAALVATGRRRLPHSRVDTLTLARCLVGDEVPDLRLSTLARLFRTTVQPTHRALDDVLATAGVFHGLLERAGGRGMVDLGDILAVPSTLPPPPGVEHPGEASAPPPCRCRPTPPETAWGAAPPDPAGGARHGRGRPR